MDETLHIDGPAPQADEGHAVGLETASFDAIRFTSAFIDPTVKGGRVIMMRPVIFNSHVFARQIKIESILTANGIEPRPSMLADDLKPQLRQCESDGGVSVITVASLIAAPNRTISTACALGSSFAQASIRVAAISANLRRCFMNATKRTTSALAAARARASDVFVVYRLGFATYWAVVHSERFTAFPVVVRWASAVILVGNGTVAREVALSYAALRAVATSSCRSNTNISHKSLSARAAFNVNLFWNRPAHSGGC